MRAYAMRVCGVLLLAAGCRKPDELLGAAAGSAAAGLGADSPVKQEVQMFKERRSGDWTPGLTGAERGTLMAIARDTLDWSVGGRKEGFDMRRYDLTPRLNEKSATFVTFKNKGRLRGCVGCLEAVEPMALSVHRSAANAARDSRFFYDPIRRDETGDIEIHVSLLSPRRPIASPDEFRIGAHGVWLTKSGRSAVYLPEVAVEQGWTREETLSSLCEKAGLPGDAWREGAELMVFSSVVIAERQP